MSRASLPINIGVVGSPLTFSKTNPAMSFMEPEDLRVAKESPLYLPPTTTQPRVFWRPVAAYSTVYNREVTSKANKNQHKAVKRTVRKALEKEQNALSKKQYAAEGSKCSGERKLMANFRDFLLLF